MEIRKVLNAVFTQDAVIGGHHDPPRQGELVILDPAKGRHEASGAVQRIPGFGKKVEPVVLDGLIGGSWPRFLHPYPLSEKYFLVSCKLTKTSLWGVYLVDVFDNFVLLYEESGRSFNILESEPALTGLLANPMTDPIRLAPVVFKKVRRFIVFSLFVKFVI